eukprot:CAMPEP_0182916566 /NCGR_PEP_ID=MMETSP0105_2-20130417/1023_1 /TAXON_ID=81532 ORGANISM="Acanthoeca-like sp., Strain 10tr" /NCGR_SAMPLE_ID=MMETSP0105_2 /ASSEMBLY_ACC=CAM_ASM_000205 /LENGTH=248 /DNA_ID=CAMNT_0025053531 /DNA_START=429 /DNA_END=1175 /DNA_ORIENTATION=+
MNGGTPHDGGTPTEASGAMHRWTPPPLAVYTPPPSNSDSPTMVAWAAAPPDPSPIGGGGAAASPARRSLADDPRMTPQLARRVAALRAGYTLESKPRQLPENAAATTNAELLALALEDSETTDEERAWLERKQAVARRGSLFGCLFGRPSQEEVILSTAEIRGATAIPTAEGPTTQHNVRADAQLTALPGATDDVEIDEASRPAAVEVDDVGRNTLEPKRRVLARRVHFTNQRTEDSPPSLHDSWTFV